jgi:hypothetical protein
MMYEGDRILGRSNRAGHGSGDRTGEAVVGAIKLRFASRSHLK